MNAQGELQFHDACDSLNEVEYEEFVFPIDDVAFCEFEDEVLDGVVFENQLTLHSKFYDDSYEVKTNKNFNCEDTLGAYGVISNFDDDVMCEYKFDHSFEVQLATFEEMQSQGMSYIYI